MAKMKSDSMMMAGGAGMAPRKAMSSGMHEAETGGSNFGVQSFVDMQGHMGMHPDHEARTGEKAHMADHERAIGEPLHHTRHHHPAQAAPHHGPMHVDGYAHHSREDRRHAHHGGKHRK